MPRREAIPAVLATPPDRPRLVLLGLAAAGTDLGSYYLKQAAWPPGVTVGDWVEIAGTYAVAFLYALLFADASGIGFRAPTSGDGRADDTPPAARPRPFAIGLFGAGMVSWILGRGAHVAANSIHDWAGRAGVADSLGLLTWWDESLAHSVEHAGLIALVLGITLAEAEAPAGSPEDAEPGRTRPRTFAPSGLAWLLLGAVPYGFIYFAGGVEGRTVAFTLPFAAGYLLAILAGERRTGPRAARPGRPGPLAGRPARLFFVVSFATALALFAAWGVINRGFPEFSATGLRP